MTASEPAAAEQVFGEEPPGGDPTRSAGHEKLRRLLAVVHRVRFGAVDAALEAFPATFAGVAAPEWLHR